MNANVAVLKQQLEQLFPGKWLTGADGDKILRTGIRDIDAGIASGFARRQISEWTGISSSGKSTLLRGAVTYWCASGLNVAYVDTFSRLVAGDWAFVREGLCGPVPLNMMQRKNHSTGEFYAVRVSECLAQQENFDENSVARKKDIRLEACWVVEQLIRSAVFDAIVFDMGESIFLSDRTFARLKRALERSKAALIILRDQHLRANLNGTAGSGWGTHTNMQFKWAAPISYENGMNGIAMITPAIQGFISRDGMTQHMETRLNTHVPNRLFTHPQIPDRRTAKARA